MSSFWSNDATSQMGRFDDRRLRGRARSPTRSCSNFFFRKLDPQRFQAVPSVRSDAKQSAAADSDVASVLRDLADRTIRAHVERDAIADAQLPA
jgi:hypothetical protein